jgi:hypothetical protein
MHTSHQQGLSRCTTSIHRAAVLTTTTISSLGTYTADIGIGVINAAASVKTFAGCTIWLGTTLADGSTLWKIRTRARETANTTAVKIAAIGQYAYDDLNAIQSLDEFLPHIVRRAWNGTNLLLDFDTAYSAQGSTGLSPQAQFGCARVFAPLSYGAFNVDVNGSRSKAWAAGQTISNYDWTYRDAADAWTGYNTSGTHTATATLSIPTNSFSAHQGGAYIKLDVTDSAGNTHTTRRLLFINWDETIDPERGNEVVTCTEITSSFGSGSRAKFVARTTYGEGASYGVGGNKFRDGAEVVVWGKARHEKLDVSLPSNTPNMYNGVEKDVFFNGYIIGDTVKRDPLSGEWSFEAASADALLDGQYQTAFSLRDTASPTTWNEVKDMTPNRAAWYAIRYYSTLANVRDVDINQYAAQAINDTHVIYGHDFGGGGFISQLRTLYDRTLSTISFDRQGTCYIEQDCKLSNDTATISADLPLFAEDCHTEISYTHTINQPVAQVYLGGSDYKTEIEATVPDNIKGYGAQNVEIMTGIAATQAQATTLAKRKYKSDSLQQSAGVSSLKVELGNMCFDVVPQSVVALKVNAGENGRIGNSPAGFIRLPFSEAQTAQTTIPSANGVNYFVLHHQRGTLTDDYPSFHTGSLILYHKNPYYNNSNVAAIGKLVRTNSPLDIGGNNNYLDSFVSVNPPLSADGNNQYTLVVYTGTVTGFGATLDSAATIKSKLEAMHGIVSPIASVKTGLTYVYNTGIDAPLVTHYRDANPGAVVDSWIVFASTAIVTLTPSDGNVQLDGTVGDHYIYAAPRAFTWAIDNQKMDMRCSYDLEPLRFVAKTSGSSGF